MIGGIEEVINVDYLSFFTRKNVKKSVMTASYDSKEDTR
jgi:hypothetical protein